VVDRAPSEAGLDPLHLRLDRNLNDNVVAVRKQ
jgi:hypothetical protein